MGDRRSQLYEPLTQRAKHMRQDIKDAVATGWLPSNLTYSVKVSSGSAIDIDVDGLNDTDRMDPQKVLWRQQDPSWRQRTESAEYFALQSRIDSIRTRYGRFESDIQSDYWNVDYYGSVDIRRESQTAFWEGERARLKARREALARRRGNGA